MTDPAPASSPLTLDAPALVRELEVAVEAVRQAALLCRTVRASLGAADRVDKADLSPVTVADLGAQALISLALADALPADPVMGEEESAPLRADPTLAAAVLARVRGVRAGLSATRLLEALDRCDDPGGPGRRFWTLDPVDGTKGFLRDEQYAVALALIEDGEVVLGVLGCPNLPLDPADAAEPSGARDGAAERGCLFVAERGSGAWQVPLVGDAAAVPGERWAESLGRRLEVDAVGDTGAACYAESVEAGHSDQGVAAAIAARLGIRRPPVRLDSQAKYAVVARGEASIYLRLPHGSYVENVWDHAAGSLIVTEAGGRVSDALGRPLDFSAGRRLTRNQGIVATSPAIHERVVAAVLGALGA